MTQFLLYSAAAFGLAYIVGHSKISLAFRKAMMPNPPARMLALPPAELEATTEDEMYAELSGIDKARFWLVTFIECPACGGFWVGLAAGFWLMPPFLDGLLLARHSSLLPLVLAFSTAGTNFLLARLTGITTVIH